MKQMSKKGEKSEATDTFRLLMTKKKKRKRKKEFLAPLGIKEFFADGSITINKRTCQGVECELCIKACPTDALFWRAGEIGLIEELCIYCGACVLSCIVDDCIRVTRKTTTGELVTFSKPRDFMILQNKINTKKRVERIREVFPEVQVYLEHYKKMKS
jgi:Fe-S-cluster-containing hydrogenase component 2